MPVATRAISSTTSHPEPTTPNRSGNSQGRGEASRSEEQAGEQEDEHEQRQQEAQHSTPRRSLALPPGPRTSNSSSVLKPISVSLNHSQAALSERTPRPILRADPNLKTCFRQEDDPELYALWVGK